MLGQPCGELRKQDRGRVPVEAVLAGADLDHLYTDPGGQGDDIEVGRCAEGNPPAFDRTCQLRERPRRDNPAVVDEHDPVGETFGLGELMGRQEYGNPAVAKVGDHLAHDLATRDVEARRRLVEKHDRGPAHKGQPERKALLFASRKLAPGRAGAMGQACSFEKHHWVDRVGIERGIETKGFDDPHAGVDATLLQHDADVSHERTVVGNRVESEYSHTTRRRLSVAFERLDCRGLARTIGAEEHEHLTGLDIEAHAVDCPENFAATASVVVNREVLNGDGRHASMHDTWVHHAFPKGRASVGGHVRTRSRIGGFRAATVRRMLDVRRLRTEFGAVQAGLARKGAAIDDLAAVVELDERRRELGERLDEMRARIKDLSRQVGELRRAGATEQAEALAAESRLLGDAERDLSAQADEVAGALRDLLLCVPNEPADDAPVGAGEHDNVIVRVEGEVRRWEDHQRIPHWDIGASLGLLDLERGAKLSGSMFVLYRGAGARLVRALCQFALDRNLDAFEEIRPPTLVRTETMVSTGHLPKFADDAYHIERDDLWAVPTAEVPLTSLARDEILDEADLPVRLMAHTSCFRREAGSAGRDTRGLLRVHEFDKVEILAYTTPEQAAETHLDLLARAESCLVDLGLTYRVVDICTGDLSFSARRCFDLEVYAPGCDQWLEVSSISWFGDFQARRANIRYRRSEDRKVQPVHTLNGSALAVPRVWAALVEVHRQEDGSIAVPEVLRPYFAGASVLSGPPPS